MEAPLHITVISPEKALLDTRADAVELPGTKGRFEVLRSHAALVSSLSEGKVSWKIGEEWSTLDIRGGFVRVQDNEITVCVEQ